MRKLLPLVAAVVVLASCADAPVGSDSRPFRMYFVPSVDAETIATSADKITDYVADRVSEALYGEPGKFEIESAIPTSYIAVVEAFGTNKADFAALTTFSYILAHDIKGYDVEAVLSVIRGTDETTYKGQIITHVDSGIHTLQDLNGKKFAFTDPASTAGFILPSRLLVENEIELSDKVFAQKHDNVVTMVYQRQADAGATYYSPPRIETDEVTGATKTVIRDARAKVMTQFPDVTEKVKIVGFTQDIPNDPWVMRNNIFEDPEKDAKLRNALCDALIEFAQTDEGRQALMELYSITGLVRADDSRYSDIRSILLESDLDLEQMLSN